MHKGHLPWITPNTAIQEFWYDKGWVEQTSNSDSIADLFHKNTIYLLETNIQAKNKMNIELSLVAFIYG